MMNDNFPVLTQSSQLAHFDATILDCGWAHGARAERYELCAIRRKHGSDRQFERAEAQGFAALIARGIFSSMPVLEVTSSGIPRSRRQ